MKIQSKENKKKKEELIKFNLKRYILSKIRPQKYKGTQAFYQKLLITDQTEKGKEWLCHRGYKKRTVTAVTKEVLLKNVDESGNISRKRIYYLFLFTFLQE